MACRIIANRPSTISDRQSGSRSLLTTVMVASPLDPRARAGSGLSSIEYIVPPWTEITRHDHREICVPRPGLYRKSRNDSWAAATTDWTGANWEQKKYSEIGLNLNTAACD